MKTTTLLKQKIDYWNQKFNEVDETKNQPIIIRTILKQQNMDIDTKIKGLINLHLRDLEEILTNIEKQPKPMLKSIISTKDLSTIFEEEEYIQKIIDIIHDISNETIPHFEFAVQAQLKIRKIWFFNMEKEELDEIIAELKNRYPIKDDII